MHRSLSDPGSLGGVQIELSGTGMYNLFSNHTGYWLLGSRRGGRGALAGRFSAVI